MCTGVDIRASQPSPTTSSDPVDRADAGSRVGSKRTCRDLASGIATCSRRWPRGSGANLNTGLLGAGKPNPHIAEELVVTVDTSRSTSATSWTSWARPTAPKASAEDANSG